MKTALTLIALALLAVLPGLWLLRSSARHALVSACLLILFATGSAYIGIRLLLEAKPPTTPAFVLSNKPGLFQTITPEQLPSAMAASRGRPVLLEFYADWCSSCIVWKEQVFSRSDVQAALSPLVLLQIDASTMSPDVQALLDSHQLAGLPALLVYDKQGQEHPQLRLLGEMSAPEFLAWIHDQQLSSL
ncbi:MAG: thioredoxin family protein [Pedobacter sp.]|nr:thioredoxin family protein [Pedobacter sp.]